MFGGDGLVRRCEVRWEVVVVPGSLTSPQTTMHGPTVDIANTKKAKQVFVNPLLFYVAASHCILGLSDDEGCLRDAFRNLVLLISSTTLQLKVHGCTQGRPLSIFCELCMRQRFRHCQPLGWVYVHHPLDEICEYRI